MGGRAGNKGDTCRYRGKGQGSRDNETGDDNSGQGHRRCFCRAIEALRPWLHARVPEMRKHLWGWAPLALYAGLILLVSLEPSPAGLSGGWGKLHHGLAYLGLPFPLMGPLFVSGASRGLAAAAAAFMAAAAYGGGKKVPPRPAEEKD